MDNNGKRWSPEQEEKLMSMIKEGKSMDDVSQAIGRSISTINTRRDKIISNMLGNDSTVEEILESYPSLTEEHIKKLSKKNTKSTKKTKPKPKPSPKPRSRSRTKSTEEDDDDDDSIDSLDVQIETNKLIKDQTRILKNIDTTLTELINIFNDRKEQ